VGREVSTITRWRVTTAGALVRLRS